MSQTWFRSDDHIGHLNILRYDARPFSTIEEHDEALINNHNALVNKNDIVWFLGDVLFVRDKTDDALTAIIKRFNGHKHLILGNHDNRFRGHRFGFGFGSIQDVKDLSINGQRIFLSHYSHRVWPGKNKGAAMLYGHSHGNLPEDGSLSFDVGVNSWDYKPVSLEQVQEKIRKILYSHSPKPAIIDPNDSTGQTEELGEGVQCS